MSQIVDYALALLLAIAMVIGGLIAITLVWVVVTEWIWIVKKLQYRAWEEEQVE
jgi:hypothetical protein